MVVVTVPPGTVVLEPPGVVVVVVVDGHPLLVSVGTARMNVMVVRLRLWALPSPGGSAVVSASAPAGAVAPP